MSIRKLQDFHDTGTTKSRQLVELLSNAICQGLFKPGESLPSINQISLRYRLSRDTVFKAYRELKSCGMIDSTPAKSYHVVHAVQRVLLILDVYSPFKETLYNEFINNLPKNYKIDLVFHFYNEYLFDSVINDCRGRYNHYVIMNFSNERLHPSLKKIDHNRLLLLDLGDFDKKDYSFIIQDFGNSVYSCLNDHIHLVKKYRKFVLYIPDESNHPGILINYFRKFLLEHKIKGEIVRNFSELSFSRDTAYLIIQQKDLVTIVKQIRQKGLEIGKDIGLIAYNDTPMYEIIEKGITAISADFAIMGRMAADFVKNRQKICQTLPARMIVRESL